MLAGGAMSGLGAYSEAQQVQQNYLYNAQVAEKSAELAEERIADALDLGGRAETGVARKAKQVKGAQVSAGASSGIALSSQSLLSVLAGTDVLEAYDIETVRENTRKEVRALEEEREEAHRQAFRQRKAAAGTSPSMALTSSLLGSATSVAGKWF